MSYRLDYSAYKARNRGIKGINIENLLNRIEHDEGLKTEEKKIGAMRAEREQRRNLNLEIVKSIAKKMQQGWPKEMLIESIQREFPGENPDRVKKLVEHWLNKYDKADEKVREVLAQVKRGEISKDEADKIIKRFGHKNSKFIDNNNDKLFNIFVESCYQSKKGQLEEVR